MTAIKIATYNIQYGFGLDGAYDLERIVDAVREADVIAFQEVTRGFMKNGGVDMVEALRGMLPDRFWASHMPADADFGSSIVDGKAEQRRFQFGNMIFSRWPLLGTRGHLLPRTLRTSNLNLQRGALEALADTPVGPIRFYSVHLDHIDPQERIAQIAALKEIAFGYGVSGGAVSGLAEFGFGELPACPDFLLLGDFNLHPGSREYRAMLTDAGDLVDVTASDTGWSFMEPGNSDNKQRLDYGFANLELAERTGNAAIDREAQGSDHMPVWLEIRA